MKKLLLLTFAILVSIFTGYTQTTTTNCFDDYYKTFNDFGANDVPNGMQKVVIGIKYPGGNIDCLMGKIKVEDSKVVPPLFIERETGVFTEPKDTLNSFFYKKVAEDVGKLYNIYTGMSATFVTENELKVRLFFIDYLKENPGKMVKAPGLSGGEAEKISASAKSIQFNTGKDVITTSSYGVLDEIAAIMIKIPETAWTINGYTDNEGNDKSNLELSKKRARAVKNYLQGKGVNEKMLIAIGHGEEDPIADNNTPDGRSLNRRVEIVPVK